VLPNTLIFAAGTLSFAAVYFSRVGAEERMMLDEFGAEYEEYMKRTGRIFPRC